MAQGDTFTLTITPDYRFAVDTITIDSDVYVTNGLSEPPKESWRTIVIENVSKDIAIQVTFSECNDDSGVPDKYKHTVTATAGQGGSASPEEQRVVTGGTAEINIEPDDGMAVDTISVNGEIEYVNDGKRGG